MAEIATPDAARSFAFRDGVPVLDLDRWSRPADRDELRLLRTVRGPVLDVGCGPGRLVAALRDRGVVVLGIDAAPTAISRAVGRGVPVVLQSVFDPIPREGSWATALLVDGNVGIGGDPERLLRRVGAVLAGDGCLVVETERMGFGRRDGVVEFEVATGMPGWFPWCWLGVDDLAAVARHAGFTVDRWRQIGDRWFVWLRKVAATSAPVASIP